MVHGARANISRSSKQFKCVVCGHVFRPGTPQVMFRNDLNREYAPGRVFWDSTCKSCADQYKQHSRAAAATAAIIFERFIFGCAVSCSPFGAARVDRGGPILPCNRW